jgi:2-oxoglutarate dehydrogenase E1 component
MNNQSNAHQDVIERFINYGENNFESSTQRLIGNNNSQQLGVLRLIYAYRFSGHLEQKLTL